jgi:hypothetical protein
VEGEISRKNFLTAKHALAYPHYQPPLSTPTINPHYQQGVSQPAVLVLAVIGQMMVVAARHSQHSWNGPL